MPKTSKYIRTVRFWCCGPSEEAADEVFDAMYADLGSNIEYGIMDETPEGVTSYGAEMMNDTMEEPA